MGRLRANYHTEIDFTRPAWSFIMRTKTVIGTFWVCLPYISLVIAGPTSRFANNTEIVSYVNDPQGRGTCGLLISCLLTLILCVWSALHLNVPGRDTTKAQSFWRNVRWIFAGIYAPELVVFTAWRQWSSARILTSVIRKLGYTRDEKRNHVWLQIHSFFASTGGFAFDTRNLHRLAGDHFLPPDCPSRITVTAHGIKLIAQCGHLPDIPEGDIRDKSKADWITKSLVILQATWLLMQVIGRLIAGLPITLLEVNTVGHVLCAFLMYALWWKKPLLPTEPIILDGEWAAPLCAFMFICSEMSGHNEVDSDQKLNMFQATLKKFGYYSTLPEIDQLSVKTTDISMSELSALPDSSNDPFRTFHIVPTSSLCQESRERSKARKAQNAPFIEKRGQLPASTKSDVSVDRISRHRFELACAALTRYPVLRESLVSACNDVHCQHVLPEQYLVERVPNWPSEALLRGRVGGLIVGIVLWASNFFYGALHAAAWNDYFPTDVERWLWRISAIYIGFCGAFWVILNFTVHRIPALNVFWDNWMDGKKRWYHDIILGSLVTICGTAFIFVRAYIVVEAFISVRQLPAAAYETPSWSQIWPHL